jgi:hypothetical protein
VHAELLRRPEFRDRFRREVRAARAVSGASAGRSNRRRQDSADASGFYLQYSSEDHGWAFARPGLRAVGRTAPAAHVWTHLTGVCDGPARKLRLYVDGVQEAVVEDAAPAPATGAFVIGRASFAGEPRDFFPGAVRDVRAFDQALAPARIAKLVRPD